MVIFYDLPPNLQYNTLKHDTTLCIARESLKKMFEKTNFFLHCKIKSTPEKGCDLSKVDNEAIPFEKSCIKLRDEGGHMWPSKTVVFITCVFIIFFNGSFHQIKLILFLVYLVGWCV